jgi:hypothetical protein
MRPCCCTTDSKYVYCLCSWLNETNFYRKLSALVRVILTEEVENTRCVLRYYSGLLVIAVRWQSHPIDMNTAYWQLLRCGLVQSVPCTASIFWYNVRPDLSSNRLWFFHQSFLANIWSEPSSETGRNLAKNVRYICWRSRPISVLLSRDI